MLIQDGFLPKGRPVFKFLVLALSTRLSWLKLARQPSDMAWHHQSKRVLIKAFFS